MFNFIIEEENFMNVPTIGANFDIAGYNTVKCTGDPQKDAKNFADANNITVDEAKKILSGQFGDPAKKADSTDANKAAATTTTVDDDAELDDDADIEVEVEEIEDVEEVDELDELEEDDEVDDGDDVTDALTNAMIAEEVDDYVDDINDKAQEVSNTYNQWQKWGGGWENNGAPLWKFHAAAKNLQASIEDFLDYVDTIDMSTLDASTKSAIESAKDDARKWSDKYAKAVKTEWWSNSQLWSMAGTARKKAVSFTETLISNLKSAGLATTSYTKPSKPTA